MVLLIVAFVLLEYRTSSGLINDVGIWAEVGLISVLLFDATLSWRYTWIDRETLGRKQTRSKAWNFAVVLLNAVFIVVKEYGSSDAASDPLRFTRPLMAVWRSLHVLRSFRLFVASIIAAGSVFLIYFTTILVGIIFGLVLFRNVFTESPSFNNFMETSQVMFVLMATGENYADIVPKASLLTRWYFGFFVIATVIGMFFLTSLVIATFETMYQKERREMDSIQKERKLEQMAPAFCLWTYDMTPAKAVVQQTKGCFVTFTIKATSGTIATGDKLIGASRSAHAGLAHAEVVKVISDTELQVKLLNLDFTLNEVISASVTLKSPAHAKGTLVSSVVNEDRTTERFLDTLGNLTISKTSFTQMMISFWEHNSNDQTLNRLCRTFQRKRNVKEELNRTKASLAKHRLSQFSSDAFTQIGKAYVSQTRNHNLRQSRSSLEGLIGVEADVSDSDESDQADGQEFIHGSSDKQVSDEGSSGDLVPPVHLEMVVSPLRESYDSPMYHNQPVDDHNCGMDLGDSLDDGSDSTSYKSKPVGSGTGAVNSDDADPAVIEKKAQHKAEKKAKKKKLYLDRLACERLAKSKPLTAPTKDEIDNMRQVMLEYSDRVFDLLDDDESDSIDFKEFESVCTYLRLMPEMYFNEVFFKEMQLARNRHLLKELKDEKARMKNVGKDEKARMKSLIAWHKKQEEMRDVELQIAKVADMDMFFQIDEKRLDSLVFIYTMVHITFLALYGTQVSDNVVDTAALIFTVGHITDLVLRVTFIYCTKQKLDQGEQWYWISKTNPAVQFKRRCNLGFTITGAIGLMLYCISRANPDWVDANLQQFFQLLMAVSTLRLLVLAKEFSDLLLSICSSLKPVRMNVLLLGIVVYEFSTFAYCAFRQGGWFSVDAPDHDQQGYWDTPFDSMITMYQLMVGEGWHEVMQWTEAYTYNVVMLYFMAYSMIVAILFTNMFIGNPLTAAQTDH